MTTKGAFLQEKAGNMRAWLQESLLSEAVANLPSLDQARATLMAEMLVPYKQAIKDEDFTRLEEAAVEIGLIDVMKEVVTHPPLHDKFWRYLALFVEVIEQ